MRETLTPKQKTLLEYLKQAVETGGSPPSLRAAASVLDISHAAVAQLLRALETKGYIRRHGKYSRTLHILDSRGRVSGPSQQKTIPIIGTITAGLPMYAQEEWDGSLVVDGDLYPGENLFALRVRGDSMKNAGILDGDLAICTPCQYARNSEVVVALINQEEATVKRFFLHPDHIELRPENPNFASRTYGFDQVLIQGRVAGIIRGPEGIQ
ncbi:MAG: transcriptional repressor LexA [Pseudomonadota bacterium]